MNIIFFQYNQLTLAYMSCCICICFAYSSLPYQSSVNIISLFELLLENSYHRLQCWTICSVLLWNVQQIPLFSVVLLPTFCLICFKRDHVVILAMPSLPIFNLERGTILSLAQKLHTPATKGIIIILITFSLWFYLFCVS